VINDIVWLSKDLLWFIWDDGVLGDVDLRVDAALAPFTVHELTILTVEGLLRAKGLVLLGQAFQVFLVVFSLFGDIIFSLLKCFGLRFLSGLVLPPGPAGWSLFVTWLAGWPLVVT
jgi:hypothetical protein